MSLRPPSVNRRFQAALLASLLLHALFVVAVRPSLSTALERRVEVELVQVPLHAPAPVNNEKAPNQIVTPSEKSVLPPKETKLRSERDSYAEKETLRRGDPLVEPHPPAPARKAPPPRPARPQAKEAPAREPEKKIAKESIDPSWMKLRLNDSQIAKTIGEVPLQHSKSNATEKVERTEKERQRKFEQTQPFQSLSGSLFRGKYGSSDHLPNIPDGDITLLNAKADRYAVFVRRVALQVFGALRKLNWQELTRSELGALNDFVLVEAVMNKSGKLLRVQVRERSGSDEFDKIARKAAELGTWDQNPPAEAADADGNIHFIFKARSWSRALPNGLSEQRWLLLGTGLL